MESLKTWVINICAAVFFITAVELILPDNSLKKYSKFVLGLILITVVMNPILKLFNNNGRNMLETIESNTKALSMYESRKDINIYKDKNIENTLKVFQMNINLGCEKLLKEKYPNAEFKVESQAYYEEGDYKIKSLSIGINDRKIKTIEKVVVKSEGLQKDEKDKNHEDIKKHLASQLNMEEKNITVYNLK